MSWQQQNPQPYNPNWPAASAAPPHNPGYSQTGAPTQSIPPRGGGSAHYNPAVLQNPVRSVPPGGYSPQTAPPRGYATQAPATSYYSQPPPTQSVPPVGYATQAPPQSSYQPQSGRPAGGGYSSQATPTSSYLPPSQPSYGGSSGPPPGVDMEMWTWFQSVDSNHSGKITAEELRQALLNNNWSHFNAETCRLLIGMFDQDKDGTISVHEFSALWKYIQEWRSCFDSFDKDRSGNIDASELQQALHSFGYQLSMDFCKVCTLGFDRSDRNTMKFDDFIQCCVMLKSLTERFKQMDTNRSGVITVSYEQFLDMALENSLF